MKKINPGQKTVALLTAMILISLTFNNIVHSQTNDPFQLMHELVLNTTSASDNPANIKNAFVAIFNDTIMEPIEAELSAAITENEIKNIIARDSVISLNSNKDTIWTFDFIIAGRRCYGTAFSGPTWTSVFTKLFSDNLIYLYSPSDITVSHMFNGIFIYNSEKGDWHFRLKTE